MLPTQWQCPTRVHGAAADKGKTQENKTIEISSPNKTDRRKPRRSDRPVYMEINSALTRSPQTFFAVVSINPRPRGRAMTAIRCA
jgi:hypothetical protein